METPSTYIGVVWEGVARTQVNVLAPIIRAPNVLEAQQVQLFQDAHITDDIHLHSLGLTNGQALLQGHYDTGRVMKTSACFHHDLHPHAPCTLHWLQSDCG